MIDVSLIGTGGMIPLKNRYLTALAARYNGSMLLIDCGEGTQVTLKELGWGFVNLDFILITHFHADHISGLPGLLLSLGNYGRTAPVTIAGPKGISSVVNSLRVIAPELSYHIDFIELDFKDKDTVNFRLGEYRLSALPLDHSLNCIGYSISIPRAGKFNAQKANEQGIPLELWSKLQKGENIEKNGYLYTPDMVLGPDRRGIKISYITDTRPVNTIPAFIDGSDLFICEGLYGDDSMKEKARKHKHMVFSEAAVLAREGRVKELWLTHYSQALTDPENCIESATGIFQNTRAGYDRIMKTIPFDTE